MFNYLHWLLQTTVDLFIDQLILCIHTQIMWEFTLDTQKL